MFGRGRKLLKRDASALSWTPFQCSSMCPGALFGEGDCLLVGPCFTANGLCWEWGVNRKHVYHIHGWAWWFAFVALLAVFTAHVCSSPWSLALSLCFDQSLLFMSSAWQWSATLQVHSCMRNSAPRAYDYFSFAHWPTHVCGSSIKREANSNTPIPILQLALSTDETPNILVRKWLCQISP